MEFAVRLPTQLQPILQALRKSRGLTQAELARRLGITQQSLSALEREPENASFGRILALLSALDAEIAIRDAPARPSRSAGDW